MKQNLRFNPVEAFFRWLTAVQEDESIWLLLDHLPELLEWFKTRKRPVNLTFGDELLACAEIGGEARLRIRVGSAAAWAELHQGAVIILQETAGKMSSVTAPAGIIERLRPIIHDAAEIAAGAGWNIEIILDKEVFLKAGVEIGTSIPPGYGPCQIHLPVLSRFLARYAGLVR